MVIFTLALAVEPFRNATTVICRMQTDYFPDFGAPRFVL